MIVYTGGRSYHFEKKEGVVEVLSKTPDGKMSQLYHGDEFSYVIGKSFIIKLNGELQLETMNNVLLIKE